MIAEEIIKKQIGQTLTGTDLNLGTKYKGKARDVYEYKGKVFLISTDRQSAFDRSIAHIPFKGQVLTQTSAFWFEHTTDIIQNHTIDVPDPNVVVGNKLTVFPVEMVIRGYLTGVTETSAWTAYARGERLFCGNVLPEGMQKNQKFPEPIITPATKDEVHDENISAEEIVKGGVKTYQRGGAKLYH